MLCHDRWLQTKIKDSFKATFLNGKLDYFPQFFLLNLLCNWACNRGWCMQQVQAITEHNSCDKSTWPKSRFFLGPTNCVPRFRWVRQCNRSTVEFVLLYSKILSRKSWLPFVLPASSDGKVLSRFPIVCQTLPNIEPTVEKSKVRNRCSGFEMEVVTYMFPERCLPCFGFSVASGCQPITRWVQFRKCPFVVLMLNEFDDNFLQFPLSWWLWATKSKVHLMRLKLKVRINDCCSSNVIVIAQLFGWTAIWGRYWSAAVDSRGRRYTSSIHLVHAERR